VNVAFHTKRHRALKVGANAIGSGNDYNFSDSSAGARFSDESYSRAAYCLRVLSPMLLSLMTSTGRCQWRLPRLDGTPRQLQLPQPEYFLIQQTRSLSES